MNLGDTNIRPITPAIEIMIYLSPTQMSKALGPLSRDVTIPCLLLSNDEPVSSPPGLFLSQMGAPSGRCACITSGFTPAPKEAPGVPLVSGSNSLAHLHQPGSAQCTSLNAPLNHAQLLPVLMTCSPQSCIPWPQKPGVSNSKLSQRALFP